MKSIILFFAVGIFILSGCKEKHHPHGHSGHGHQGHGTKTFQITEYSDKFELFAEAQVFVVGKQSNILAHFSNIPDFTAVGQGGVTVKLRVDHSEVKQELEHPTRKGIYSFNITPEISGEGVLTFEIETRDGKSLIEVRNIKVYADKHAAEHAEIGEVQEGPNSVVFTKEQSWKIDFCTEQVAFGPIGQVVKTVAKVEPAQSDEVTIAARTSGIVNIANNDVVIGKTVSKGEYLFLVSDGDIAENNATVRYALAESDYMHAKAEYERALELSKDKIVSENELADKENVYKKNKAVFDNLKDNFNAFGQIIKSPVNGVVSSLHVSDGQFVETGRVLLTIAQNKELLLHADIQSKYVSILNTNMSANIRSTNNEKVYTLQQLNGRVLSVGKNVNATNYLVPVNILIRNTQHFVPGGFVEVYLKSSGGKTSLTIPNTALIEELGNYFVFVQQTPELFEKREVKVGATDGIRTEIISGLNELERIVSRGATMVKLARSSGALDAHSGHVH